MIGHVGGVHEFGFISRLPALRGDGKTTVLIALVRRDTGHAFFLHWAPRSFDGPLREPQL